MPKAIEPSHFVALATLALALGGCVGPREVTLADESPPVTPIPAPTSTQLVVVVESVVDGRGDHSVGNLSGPIIVDDLRPWLKQGLLSASTDKIVFAFEPHPGFPSVSCQATVKKAYVRPSSTSIAGQVVIEFVTMGDGAPKWDYLSRGGISLLNMASTETDIRGVLEISLEESIEQYRAELASRFSVEEGEPQRAAPVARPSRR